MILAIIIILDNVLGKIPQGGLCLMKYLTRQDCVVDYGEIGTFSTEYPWSKIDDCPLNINGYDLLGRRPAVVPATPEYIGTKFTFLNKLMRSIRQAVDFDLDSVEEKLNGTSYFQNKKTFIYVHGWQSSSGSSTSSPSHPRKLLYNAFKHLEEDVNLILVDWKKGASNLRYWIPATNTRVVGSQVERLVSLLIGIGYNSVNNFHLSGHSLGSHICGYAGKYFIERNHGIKLPRITGLDPAGPMFQYEDTEILREIRLDREDADVVDIIHSNAGELDIVQFFNIIDLCDTKQEMVDLMKCSITCVDKDAEFGDILDQQCLEECNQAFNETMSCVRTDLFREDPLNVGMNEPIGDVDFWPNGGIHHEICNQTGYFPTLTCDHSQSISLMAATIRDECHQSRKCHSYDDYLLGKCSKNEEVKFGYYFDGSGHDKSNPLWNPENYFLRTEFESGNYCSIADPDYNPDNQDPSPGTVEVISTTLLFLSYISL